ncbi:MAG: transcription elongation factor GreA [Deltaproteobacteria bacterium]|nr:transcription elongation factor GreA [Deltaproteobacteria bacterium]
MPPPDRVPITVMGHEKLKEELRQLKTVERKRISSEIEVARAHGDLRENAEYHAAKEKQGFIEGRIMELEDKLSRAQVIDPTKLGGDRVVFGATVRFADGDSGEESTYQIVGDDEADLKAGKVSISSPIARAFIGKEKGDEVEIRSPKGVRTVEIINVTFK